MTLKLIHNKLLPSVVSFVAGTLLTLAFAPFHLYPLAVICPAVLLMLWINKSPRQAFRRGYCFGLGLFSTGVYWVFTSIHTYGNTTITIATLITVTFILILALFPALTGYWLNRFFPRPHYTKILFAFPVIWILLEWVRSWIFSGFPWLLLGTSQVDSPLSGYAPIGSVYLVSLAVLVSSGLLVMWINALIKSRKAWVYPLSIVMVWLIGAALSFIPWTRPFNKPIPVSLIQGNIEQDLKWSFDQIQPTLEKYLSLTEKSWNSKLIVWPESAIPIPLHTAEEFVKELDEDAAEHHTSIITGIPIKAPKEGYYNAVIAVGEGRGFYAKRRLVPFGEYVPLDPFFGRVLALLNVPMSNFIPGTGPMKPITIDGINLATFICYEIAYPELVAFPQKDINLLLTLSNDAWFGESIAQPQHLQMAQMRAQEMRRPILFVSNTGLTAIVTPKGEIQSSIPPNQTAVLTDTVQPMKGRTPWQRFGMDPVLAILLIMLFFAIKYRKKHEK